MSALPDLGPKPHLGYTESRLERAAELRTDKAAIDALSASVHAGAYVIGGELIVTKKHTPLHDPLFTLAEARSLGAVTESIFLGHREGEGRFGFGIAQDAAEALKTRDDLMITDLRSIAVQGGISVIVSVPTAVRQANLSIPAGNACARPARPSTSRGPIPS
jgi:NAD+ diphosphatase